MGSPLDNRSVVITRSISQNESLRRLLEARGARVVEVPLIAITEPEDEGCERDEVLQHFDQFDWIVVTSPNGADCVAPFLVAAHAAGDAERFPSLAAVGEATARSLGVTVAMTAIPARADVLAEQFPTGTGSVLVVQGNLADDSLSSSLRAKGWAVTQVVAYRTVQLRPTREIMLPAMAADVLLLASGSAANAWFDAFGTTTPPFVVAMGPSTAKVASAADLRYNPGLICTLC
jgi:uroporphyrinogen-III synthase